MDKHYLTQERYDALAAELQKLNTEGRQAVAKRLKFAKELGDLSENAEYESAREEKAELEKKIVKLQALLQDVAIIKGAAGSDTVKVGSKVKLKKGETTLEYTIVGSNEADPLKGFISNSSPLGRGIIGKKSGETVTVQTPKGEMAYQIVAVA
jgi:transcription elongation factor GreA